MARRRADGPSGHPVGPPAPCPNRRCPSVVDDGKADTGKAMPLVEERLVIARCLVETGRVRVHLSTASEDALARETLRDEHMEVERVALGHEVASAPAVREEDGVVLVVPVLEETLVVERRLVLKEELRIRRIATTETVEETIPLRRQVASV